MVFSFLGCRAQSKSYRAGSSGVLDLLKSSSNLACLALNNLVEAREHGLQGH